MIKIIYRKERLFTYEYILIKRIKDFKRELAKPENKLTPMIIILKKIISNEKIITPRLDVFEKIFPSPPEQS